MGQFLGLYVNGCITDTYSEFKNNNQELTINSEVYGDSMRKTIEIYGLGTNKTESFENDVRTQCAWNVAGGFVKNSTYLTQK